MAQDDFTFPATTTADSQPHFIGSPALWRHPSATRQNSEILSKDEHEQDDQEKSNMSLMQEFKASSIDEKENTFNDDEEEKMDMLWEDLNEEFSRNCGKSTSQKTDVSSPGRPVQVSCIRAMKLSKANGHVLSGMKSSNILVFIKIVKRAFKIHNSGRSIKKNGKYF